MSSLSQLKETVYSSCSGIKSGDMMSSIKQLLKYGQDHPLQLVAGVSFVFFALLPTLAFVGFALGTILATLVAAIAWELFLIVSALVGLGIALSVAVMLAACCTGAAAILYLSLATARSSLQWVIKAPTLYPSYRQSSSSSYHTGGDKEE